MTFTAEHSGILSVYFPLEKNCFLKNVSRGLGGGEKKMYRVFCVPVTNSSHIFQSPLGTNTPMLSAARLSVNSSSCPGPPLWSSRGRRPGMVGTALSMLVPCLVSFPVSCILFFLILSLVLLASGESASWSSISGGGVNLDAYRLLGCKYYLKD